MNMHILIFVQIGDLMENLMYTHSRSEDRSQYILENVDQSIHTGNNVRKVS